MLDGGTQIEVTGKGDGSVSSGYVWHGVQGWMVRCQGHGSMWWHTALQGGVSGVQGLLCSESRGGVLH